MILLIISCITILSFSYAFFLPRKTKNFIGKKRVVLFVIAHPDDECMFFAPTILNIARQNSEIYLLCLSSGGYRFESVVRKQELRKSCQTLGIPPSNLIIIEHSTLPDNPKRKWSKMKVGPIILKYLLRLSANVIISFDEGGVSGHSNHIDICEGIKYLNSKSLLPTECDVYFLKSVSILQKYVAFLFVYLNYLQEDFCFISNCQDILTTQNSDYVYDNFVTLWMWKNSYSIVAKLRMYIEICWTAKKLVKF